MRKPFWLPLLWADNKKRKEKTVVERMHVVLLDKTILRFCFVRVYPINHSDSPIVMEFFSLGFLTRKLRNANHQLGATLLCHISIFIPYIDIYSKYLNKNNFPGFRRRHTITRCNFKETGRHVNTVTGPCSRHNSHEQQRIQCSSSCSTSRKSKVGFFF